MGEQEVQPVRVDSQVGGKVLHHLEEGLLAPPSGSAQPQRHAVHQVNFAATELFGLETKSTIFPSELA